MKKLFALLLCMVLFATSIPLGTMKLAQADEVRPVTNVTDPAKEELLVSGGTVDAMPIRAEEPMGSAKDPSKEALEAAIRAVKSKITIPKEYSEFDYYFYNSNSNSDFYWRLSWRNPNNSSRINVNCDQNNNITAYSKYDYPRSQDNIPKYLKKELKSTADAFIKQIALKLWTRLEYVDASYDGIYSGSYTYRYRRVENGVLFPDNMVNVSVNSVTGEVTNAELYWHYDINIPSNKVKLTKEEAAKLIKENMEMKLVYRSDYYRIYDNSNPTKNAYLVYEPTKLYISVDAKTGEVYLSRSEYRDLSSNGEKGASSDNETVAEDAGGSYVLPLTEEEIAKIKELEKLISKDDAIKKVTKNQYLYLDKTLKAYSANLSKYNYGTKEARYVWDVTLSDPREIDYDKEDDYYRAYAYAQVDAKTGRIISFYANVKDQYNYKTGTWNNVKIPYDKEAGRSILEKFLNNQISTYFKNSILVDQNDDYIAYYKEKTPIYGGYYYNYNRVNEGVEYPYNGIYGNVDGITGKIYSYGYNWDEDIVFESPKGVITPEQAIDYYLSKDGFELKYEINEIQIYDPKVKEELYDYSESYQVEYEVRLVYRPDINPSFIDPFTGEQLEYNGEVYKVTKPFSYLDITDTPDNRAILLLADMNIGFEGEYFKPEQNITSSEFMTLMEKVGYGYGETKEALDQSITREEVAGILISKLGLDKISKLPNIYKTGYSDEGSIDPSYLGAVALAKAMELMEAEANNMFNPKSKVTRAQAVNLIMSFIGVRQEY